MTPERWKQVEELFQSALERPAGGQRAAFLDEVCGGDAELRRQVDALIDSHERAGSSKEAPARAAANATVEEPRDELAGSIVGRRIGAYQVVREIGRGGMGAVYLAARADDVFDRRVAIKLVKRGMDTDFILRRFRHERQILANLDHPNIARLFDGGTTEDGLPYFVMEYIDGQPIHHYCDTRRLSVTERLRLFRLVCAAVAYAHQSRVIHRDIKPGNILVTADGTPKLLDFGIAKLLNPEMITDTYDPTGTALRLMTPEYASPEQVRGEPITAASDVYSLGVLLYELLSGHRPYPLLSRLPHEVARVICEVNPERPSVIIGNVDGILLTDGIKNQNAATAEAVARCRNAASVEILRRELAADLDGVVLKAMRKETSERYLSVEQFSEDIRRHLDGLPVSAMLLIPGHDNIADGGGHVAGLLREPATVDRSIAVLPLKTLRLGGTDDTGDEYLGLGLADAVINRLSNIRRITVRPTSSVLKYMQEANDPFTAGEELGVGFVLDGRIQRIGDRIRVTVQLVSMRDGAPLWASQFDEKYTDILSLEDSISAQVAEALIPKLTGEEREQLTKRGTDNPEAFEAYLRGRYHWNTYTEEGLAKAIVHFNQAIAVDPSYAAAYTGVADYYNWLGVYSVLPPRECFSAAKEAATRAIAIDDTLAEAFTSLGFAVWAYDWDWRESERLFKRALELNPNYLPAHEWYAHVLGSSGRHPEAIAEMRRAIELDPQSAALAAMFAFELRVARQYDEGVEQLRRAIAIEPNNHLVLQGFGWVYGQQARFEEALAATGRAVELSGRTHLTLWTHGYMLAVSGREREARQVLTELHDAARHRYVSPCFMALINTGLGDYDEAFKCLDRAVDLRDYWLVWLGVEPRFDALRSDPRFRQLLKRIEAGKLKSGAQATTIIDASFAPASRVAGHHDAAHHRHDDEATSPSHVVDTLGDGVGARPLMRRLPAAALAVLLALTASTVLYFKPWATGVRRLTALTRLTGDIAVDWQPKWSPDSSRLVFTSFRDGKPEIYATGIDGNGLARLTLNTTEDFTPAWSPDGKKIAFVSKRDGNDEIYVMNADGGNQTNISNNAAVDSRPAWSPDGMSIVFTSNRAGPPDNHEIYLMDIDGNKVTRLTTSEAFESDPSWSSDGGKIAFASNRDGNFEVYVMDPDGGNQMNISNNAAFDGKPVWAPDGRRLAFTSNRDGDPNNYDIWVMSAGGGDARRLTDNPKVDDEPAWSPDGSMIAFQSERDGNFEIYVTPADAPGGGRAKRTGAPSIAVLPFKTEEASGEDVYLGFGLADAVTARIGQLRQISVRPSSAVRRYLNTSKSAAQIGQELDVDYVLTGLIKRAGDGVAVTARLTDARDGGTLWEEKYDERSTDIAAMQGKISERVTRAMTLELTSDEQQLLAKRYTDNGEAYQLYLAGRYHWGKRTGEALKQAIYLFEQALSKDRNYALAYAGLADCYALLSWYNSPPPPDAFPKAKEAAMRAIQLDEGLAEAHASLAFVLLYYERDWAGAEREFRRAIELNPSYATAHHWYAFNLAAMGRHNEALAEIKRAQELDPNSLIIGTAVANVLYYARQYDQTIEQCLRMLEVDPGFIPAYMVLRGAYTSKGLHDEAAAILQKENSYAGDHLGKVARLAHLHAAAGRRDEAHTALGELRRLRRQQPLFAYEIATVHAQLKENDEAFAWLATAERERTIGFAFIKVDPDLDNLRADPRFDAMLQRIGLTQ